MHWICDLICLSNGHFKDEDRVCGHSQGVDVFKMAIRRRQSAVGARWVQVGNYLQSVCDNAAVNWQKLQICKLQICCGLHAQKFTLSSYIQSTAIDLKLKYRIHSTNSNIIAAGRQLNSKWQRHSATLLLYRNITRLQPVGNQFAYQLQKRHATDAFCSSA